MLASRPEIERAGVRTRGAAEHVCDPEPLSSTDKFITMFIFLYWLAYENVVFFYSAEFGGTAFFLFTNVLKLVAPLCLLAYTGLPSVQTFTRGRTAMYLCLFGVFLLWGLVPTVVSGDPMSWLKLLPRVAFFLALLTFFSQRPLAFALVAKFIVLYVLLALVQYVLVYLTRAYESPIASPNGLMAGPFGILGNVTSMMTFPGAPIAFVRLSGFWNEPSNASGNAFAAFFLARFLAATGHGQSWRRASTPCGVAGVLAFSNAGYLAFGCALLAGAITTGSGVGGARRYLRGVLLLPIGLALIVIVFVGRSYVVQNLADNPLARALTGARDLSADSFDPTNGRLDLIRATAESAESSIIGVGIQEVGSGGIDSSASAPLYWLLLTGIPGLALLLARETVLLSSAHSLAGKAPGGLPLAQALVAIMAQQAIYGSWMNPNYLVLAAMILVWSTQVARQSTPRAATAC